MSLMRTLIFLVALLLSTPVVGQQRFTLDASSVDTTIPPDKLRMGNAGAKQRQLRVNSRFLTYNGAPVIPVMGEVHYSRIPQAQWEDVVLKMKAGGITIIASYVIWIHHEEVEGIYDWSGNKSLREFAELCQKHDVWFYPRIGPWVHGEVRNGGTPDWILTKKLVDRSNDPLYQSYVEKWYEEISNQLHGLYFKDGGPVMGIQLENEYARGKEGEEHIRWLKQTAIKLGMDVPLYTVTGWGNASVPENEVIPLWGAYPDEPWAANLARSTNCDNFQFTSKRDDEKIGNDLSKRNQQKAYTYPYFTCEMGIGIQNTDHRRLQIDKRDGLALMLAKLGAGSNLIGYYVFAGGNNPVGKLSTLEENREHTGYWNTNAKVEYDFQAPIRGSGKTSAAYHELKRYHYFLSEFGDRLAQMQPIFQKADGDFQYVIRGDGKSAFLFGINFCRHVERSTVKDAEFEVQLKNDNITFPERPIQIPDSSIFVWPLNMELGQKVVLKYATMQPICQTRVDSQTTWIFSQTRNIPVEMFLRKDQIANISATGADVISTSDGYLIRVKEPLSTATVAIEDNQKIKQRILLVSEAEAKHLWLLKNNTTQQVFFSSADLTLNNNRLRIASTGHEVTIRTLGTELCVPGERSSAVKGAVFNVYTLKQDKIELPIAIAGVNALSGARWLRSGIQTVKPENELYHRFFKKQINIARDAAVENVRFCFFTDTKCNIQVNGKWVGQPVRKSEANMIDLTGYVGSGENDVIVEFPFLQGNYGYIGKINVEFKNGEVIEFPTDDSWLAMDSYTFPAAHNRNGKFQRAEFLKRDTTVIFDKVARYELLLPQLPPSLSNAYLDINYVGDKAALYAGGNLVGDNFNSQATWQLGINRLRTNVQDLKLNIIPLEKSGKIYFDVPNARTLRGDTDVTSIKIQPEYKFEMDLIQ